MRYRFLAIQTAIGDAPPTEPVGAGERETLMRGVLTGTPGHAESLVE